MAPAWNLLRQHYDGYGGCFFAGANSEQYSFDQEKASLVVVSSPMAEEEEEEEEHVGCSTSTTSKEEGDDPYKGWLQLGIPSHQTGSSPNNSIEQTSSSSTGERARSSELNLLQAERLPPLPVMTSSSIFPNIQPVITWGLRGPPPTTITDYSFSQGLGCAPSSSFGPATGSGAEFRVVSPPARPWTGVWFELKAAEIQGRQPFLPQIPKSYLRIKDGRMPVRLLMKYLANKLELGDESQVEISCRGQQLHPLLTLQQIRDNIWCTAPMVTMMPPLNLPIAAHVMILHYGRRA